MHGFIMLLLTPIMILNLFGGIGSGIWLLITGEWGIIISGIVIWVASIYFLIPAALIPTTILIKPILLHTEKRDYEKSILLGSISILYTYFVMTVYCVAVLHYFIEVSDRSSFLPALIWAYAIGSTPWNFLAKYDSGHHSKTSAGTGNIGFTVMILMVIFFHPTWPALAIAFGAVMLVTFMNQVSDLRESMELDRLSRRTYGTDDDLG